MDPKDLSPAYLTSLASLLIGALLVGVSSSILSVLGWVLLLAGLGLNILSTLVLVQRSKGGPLPALLTGQVEPAETEVSKVRSGEPQLDELEPVTESQEIIPSDTAKVSDERIFRPRPHVR